jgi:hypothetical protein
MGEVGFRVRLACHRDRGVRTALLHRTAGRFRIAKVRLNIAIRMTRRGMEICRAGIGDAVSFVIPYTVIG